jgi:hypothetical protein
LVYNKISINNHLNYLYFIGHFLLNTQYPIIMVYIDLIFVLEEIN